MTMLRPHLFIEAISIEEVGIRLPSRRLFLLLARVTFTVALLFVLLLAPMLALL